VQLTAPPVIYCAAVNSCLSITSREEDNQYSFQYLFETLARKGVFLDDWDDVIITEVILSNQHPFNMVSFMFVLCILVKFICGILAYNFSLICIIARTPDNDQCHNEIVCFNSYLHTFCRI